MFWRGGSQSWIWPNLRSLVQNFFILVYELRNSSRMFWKAIIFIEQLPFLKFKAVFLEGKYSRVLKNVLRTLYHENGSRSSKYGRYRLEISTFGLTCKQIYVNKPLTNSFKPILRVQCKKYYHTMAHQGTEKSW